MEYLFFLFPGIKIKWATLRFDIKDKTWSDKTWSLSHAKNLHLTDQRESFADKNLWLLKNTKWLVKLRLK